MRSDRRITFSVRRHSLYGTQMVEVRRGGEFVAGVYGHRNGVRVVSKYLVGTHRDSGQPPAVVVRLGQAMRNPGARSEPRGPENQEILDLLLRDVLERLTTEVKQSEPFESFREACLHLELGLNALEHHGDLPPADQDPEVCRGLLLELAVACLKAVCNLYPSGRETTERSAP